MSDIDPIFYEKFKEFLENKLPRLNLSQENMADLDESDLFMELVRDISNELNVEQLCHKILTNVVLISNADRSSLFLARGSAEKRFLVSVLFDVTRNSTVEDTIQEGEMQIHIPFGVGIAGHVAQTKRGIRIDDAYADPRFNKEVDIKTGYATHSICCMPILNRNGDVMGVAQLINKKDKDHVFSNRDVEVLLDMTRSIFQDQTNIDDRVKLILEEISGLIECSHCIVFLCNDFNSIKTDFIKGYKIGKGQSFECIKEPELNGSIAAKIGSTLLDSNHDYVILDQSEIESYLGGVADEDIRQNISKGQIKDLLCIAIRSETKLHIGAALTINKGCMEVFNAEDAELLQAFGIFCGIGIYNSKIYEDLQAVNAKQRVALDVLSYHTTADEKDVFAYMAKPTLNLSSIMSDQLNFNDEILTDDQTVMFAVQMMEDLGFVRIFNIKLKVLYSYVLTVKKNYRSVTYHNWRHGLNVTQAMFMILKSLTKIEFTELEKFALMIACLCHDLDHRGTNNAFEFKIESPLAMLYSSSTLEHHHFDQCVMILNNDANNIAKSLNEEQYRLLIDYMEDAILSTDLAVYFKRREIFRSYVADNAVDWEREGRKKVLRGMLMTACDLAAICRPWNIQEAVAHRVANEFFEQGDIERQKLNIEPIAMMDRRKKDELPSMQVGFIQNVCIPLYEVLAKVDPVLEQLLNSCRENQEHWSRLDKERIELGELQLPTTLDKQDEFSDKMQNDNTNCSIQITRAAEFRNKR
ncbi:hypothetical protein ACOME3_010342 [Neoechinorhynchus agilis]